VYLYTHWTGDSLPTTVAAALRRGKGRWSDNTYLTRIVFSEMIKGDILGETGFGIAASIDDVDGEDRIVDVDTAAQTVTLIVFGPRKQRKTFADYVKQSRRRNVLIIDE
jgi:hypothetical protein